MLFLIEASIPCEHRIARLNKFANMALEKQTDGTNVKILGRWHHLQGSGATVLIEAESAEEISSLCLVWTPFSESIKIIPVLEDKEMVKAIKNSPMFEEKK